MTNKKNINFYLLPNVLTTLTLFSGFLSVTFASKQQFVLSCFAVFIAMITDSLDGRIARMMDSASEFGKQYDSLADLVAFGVAPAFLLYTSSLHVLPSLGWSIAFAYLAAAALRLARFNLLSNTSSSSFEGLPTPMAAALVVSYVWLFKSYEDATLNLVASGVLLILAFRT